MLQPLSVPAALTVQDVQGRHFRLGDWRELDFGPGQVVLMRKDPPVDADYLHDTQLLGMAQRQGARVVNDPQGLRDFNEKLAALLFPPCCPPTRRAKRSSARRQYLTSGGARRKSTPRR